MTITHNFTVRAEDHVGGYSDREFSIVVKNTNVNRYLVVDATDAYTSPDMVSWTKRVGQGGFHVATGGGKWMIHTGGLNAITYRLSSDGIMFSNHSVKATGYTFNSIGEPPVWYRGYWWVVADIPSNYSMLLKSENGIDWSICSRGPTGGGGNTTRGSITFDGNIAFITRGFTATTNSYYWFDITSETQGPSVVWNTATAPGGVTAFWGAPVKINNRWCMLGKVSTNAVCYYSDNDRATWTAGTVSNVFGASGVSMFMNIQYNRGSLITTSYSNISAPDGARTNVPYYSDNGINWHQGSNPTTTMNAVPTNTRANVVAAKGRTYLLVGSNKYVSTDLGRTWTSASSHFPAGITAIYGFATTA